MILARIAPLPMARKSGCSNAPSAISSSTKTVADPLKSDAVESGLRPMSDHPFDKYQLLKSRFGSAPPSAI
jgi:hypothetical protein